MNAEPAQTLVVMRSGPIVRNGVPGRAVAGRRPSIPEPAAGSGGPAAFPAWSVFPLA